MWATILSTTVDTSFALPEQRTGGGVSSQQLRPYRDCRMGNLDARQQAAVKLAAAVVAVAVLVVGSVDAIGSARDGEGTDATALIWIGLLAVALLWMLNNLRQLLSRR